MKGVEWLETPETLLWVIIYSFFCSRHIKRTLSSATIQVTSDAFKQLLGLLFMEGQREMGSPASLAWFPVGVEPNIDTAIYHRPSSCDTRIRNTLGPNIATFINKISRIKQISLLPASLLHSSYFFYISSV